MVVPCQVWVARWSLVNSWRSESRESMVAFSLVLWVGWWFGLAVEGCDDDEQAGVFFVEAAVV